MFAVARWTRSLGMSALLFVGLLEGCVGQPAGPVGDEADDAPFVSRGGAALSRGRQVDITTTLGLGPYGEDQNVAADSLIVRGDLFWLCLQETVTFDPWFKTTDVPQVGQCRAANPDESSLAVTGQGWKLDFYARLQLCVGHRALEAADRVTDVHMQNDTTWSDIKTDQTRWTIRTKRASSRASLALVAVEAFRESAMLYSRVLTTCQSSAAANAAALALVRDGSSYGEVVTANLADALTSMNEAAEKATRHLNASAAARSSIEADRQLAQVAAWRERHDARLEGASAYVPVPARSYEAPLAALRRMKTKPTDGRHFATTSDAAVFTFGPVVENNLGWILPPESGPRAGFEALNTWQDPTGRLNTVPVSIWDPSAPICVGGDCANGEWKIAQLEGWIPITASAETEDLWLMVSSGSTDYALIHSNESLPGYTRSQNRTVRVYKSPKTFAGTHPVVTAFATTASDKRAENLLRGHLVNPALRGSALQDALLAALNIDENGLFSRFLPVPPVDSRIVVDNANYNSRGLALIADLGISADELDRAAGRIVQIANVTGTPIVLSSRTMMSGSGWAFSLDRMSGIGTSGAAVNPWYLYAITGGAEPPLTSEVDSTLWNVEWTASRAGVLNALDYFKTVHQTLDATTRAALTPSALRTFDSARAWVDAQLAGRVVVGISKSATASTPPVEALNGVRVYVLDLPDSVTSNADVQGRYDVWIGEEGLNCALIGSANGCGSAPSAGLPAKRVQNEAGFIVDPSVQGTRRRARITVPITEAPVGTRLYVSELVDGMPKVIASFTVALPVGAAGYRFMVVPTGPALAEALSTALAVDTTNPEDSAVSCAGLPRNIKFGLENELVEGSDGADNIESSYAYYLKRAKDAAERADDLGNQLVEQGLQMDMRSEFARNELEDLCGGIINVGRLQQAACDSSAKCDLGKLLTDANATLPAGAKTEVEGVRRCLGLDGAGSHWAALGDSPVCVWEYHDAKASYPPCLCPTDAAGNKTPACATLTCPMAVLPGKSCTTAFTKTALPDFDTNPAHLGLGVRLIDKTLNVYVSDAPKKPEGPEDSTFSCRPLLELRESLKTGVRKPNWIDLRNQFDWLNQKDLRVIGGRVGLRQDPHGFVKVTVDGATMIDFGNLDVGITGPSAFSWPCARHPAIAADEKATASCGSDAARSMYCGGHCGTCTATGCDPGAIVGTGYSSDTGDISKRLEQAVFTLKGITGASWGNSQQRSDGVFVPSASLPIGGGYLSGGVLPGWYRPYDAGGREYTVTADGQSVCDHRVGQNVRTSMHQCTSIVTAQQPALWRASPFSGALGTGGWPENPWFLWYDGCSLPGYTLPGCGDLTRMFTAHGTLTTPVRATLTSETPRDDCPSIPTNVCAGYVSQEGGPDAEDVVTSVYKWCGKDIRESCYWEEGQYGAHGWIDPVLVCNGRATGFDPKLKAKYDCDEASSEPYYTMGTQVDYATVLDALELACEVKRKGTASCLQVLSEPVTVGGVQGFPEMEHLLECAVEEMEKQLEQQIVGKLPGQLIAQLGQAGLANVYPDNRGAYGGTVARMAAEFQSMRQHSQAAVSSLRHAKELFAKAPLVLQKLGFTAKISDLDAYLDALRASGELTRTEVSLIESRLRMQSRFYQEMQRDTQRALGWFSSIGNSSTPWSAATNILVGWGEAASDDYWSSKLDDLEGWAAGDIDQKLQDLRANGQSVQEALDERAAVSGHLTEVEKTIYLMDVAEEYGGIHDNLIEALGLLAGSFSHLQGMEAELEGQRNKAGRAAATVLMLESDDVGRQYAVNATMRARMNTLRVRYERAHQDAVRMAYLARRALEQKIGMDLSLMTSDLDLVPAPRSWADTVCAMQGIDYDKVRTGGASESEEPKTSSEPYDYSTAYVGDYVALLEHFMDAYQRSYPFQDEEDVVVVSLRDDVLHARAPALVEGWNELLYTEGPLEEKQGSYGAWQFSCQATSTGVINAQAVVSAESPFECDETGEGTCRGLGDAHAVVLGGRVSATGCASSGGTGVPVDAPSLPPATGLLYWYRADACTLATSSACEDQSNNGRPSYGAVGAVSLVPNGIGGRPTLEFGQGARIPNAQNTASEYPEYTLSAVVRAPVGTAYMWETTAVRADGRQAKTNLTLDANLIRFNADQDERSNAGPFVGLYAGTEYAPVDRPAEGDIITVRAGAEGAELYVNGALRVRSPRPATASNLRGHLVNASGAPMQWAESLTYGRRLSDEDLAHLHSYLSSRYGKSPKTPVAWYSADVLQELYSTGSSPTTGYRIAYPTSVVPQFDAATGRGVGQAGPAQTLVPFSGGRHGLRFGPGNYLTFASLSSAQETVANVSAPVQNPASDEFAATVVANVESGAVSRLVNVGFFPSPDNMNTAVRSLEVDCEGSRIQLRDTNQATAFGAVAAVTCGVPFVVSWRSSASRNTTDIFVNGRLTHSQLGSLRASGLLLAGGYGGAQLKGVLADMQFHMNNMSDSDLLELHAQLGTKFAIATPAAPVAGTGTLTAGPARVEQPVQIEPGDYWLSWYQPRLNVQTAQPAITARIEHPDGTSEEFQPAGSPADTAWPEQTANLPVGSVTEAGLKSGWVRHYYLVSFDTSGIARVGFEVPGTPILFAAPQLERVRDQVSSLPQQFFATADTRKRVVGDQEDRDGATFRSMWNQGAEYYCPPGTGRNCGVGGSPAGLGRQTFNELKFALSQGDIERGKLLANAGFAKGNFNYRFIDVAVNVVGVGVKDCSSSSTPSTCYAGNFATYSLRHDGPFRVRNYDGDEYDTSLFAGNLQSSKALLAERYFSNPISTSDRSLISDYWRQGLRGRPLDGNFRLRMYDADGLNWNAVEDVQLVIRYRYWTRLN